MKINWGQGIAIFLVCFVSFLAFAVYKASLNRVHLTEQNYYRTDQEFNEQLNAANRSLALEEKVNVSSVDRLVTISFPSDFGAISGSIHCFKPNDALLDKKYIIKTSPDNKMIIDASRYASGAWTIKVKWQEGGVDYFDSKDITL